MSLRDLDYKKGGIFAAGVLFGTAGIRHFQARMQRMYIQRLQQQYFVQRIVY